MIEKTPLLFEEYFELAGEETSSPFITANSRSWGRNLSLKCSVFSSFLLIGAFLLSWHQHFVPLSNVMLLSVYFIVGIPALIETLEELFQLDINIDMLMTLAAFSSIWIGSGMEGGLLLVLFAISGSMEEAVRSKAKSAIQSLHRLSPTKAVVLNGDGILIERAVKEVKKEDKILVKAGQITPLDGTVIEGISSVNLVHLTGENLPVRKQIGDTVPAGARNLEGALVLEVTHSSQDSTLSKIIQLVTQAEKSRPKLQRWFDRFSSIYALTIISLAALFTVVFPLILGIPYLGNEGSIYRSLAFLIAASPCALIIAIPIAYLSAISVCARRGIILKGGVSLDALAMCKSIAFDKTGTLTTGKLSCIDMIPLEEGGVYDERTVLSIALALEQKTVHPIASALIQYIQTKGIMPAKIDNFRLVAGYGLEAEISESKSVYIGNEEYLLPKLEDSKKEQISQKIQFYKNKGEMISILSVENQNFLFRFTEQIRPGVRKTLENLRNHWNLNLIMLTGDHHQNAEKIAKSLSISQFFSQLNPEEKLKKVAELSSQGLAMVGDGINDAPSLARATIGICMGKVGSTPAIDAAGIILLHDSIELLDWLYAKAKKTEKIVSQNLVIAISAILFASIPALAGLLPLWLAVILHEGGTVLVGLNALRLLKKYQ